MSDISESIERLDDFLEDLATEIEPHTSETERYLDCMRELELPLSSLAVFSMFPRIESLRIGIFTIAREEEHYSLNILYRSLIEHFLKINYIWMRMLSEKTDEVGVDYWVFGGKKENSDYIKSLAKAFDLCGLTPHKEPAEILREIGVVSDKASLAEIQKRQNQFAHKNMAKYISDKEYFSEGGAQSLLTKFLPEYSRLSSSVHGGPYSASAYDISSQRLVDTVEVSVFTSLLSRYIFYLMAYQTDKNFEEILKIGDRYITYFANSAQLLVTRPTELGEGK